MNKKSTTAAVPAVKPQDDIALVFGEGDVRIVAGRKIVVRFLSLNDLIEIQQRIGGMEHFDQADLGHMRFLLYLILRKGDPDLTPEQLDAEEYPLTEREVGRTLGLAQLKSPEMKAFLDYVFVGSGLKTDDENGDDGDDAPNDPAVEAAPA